MSDFLAADAGIRQLAARFVDAAFRQDAEEFAQCFTRDGVWRIAGMDLRGRAAIQEAAPRLLGYCERIQLIPLDPILEVSGKTAVGRSHMIEFSKLRDGTSAFTIGVYHDRFAEEDGRWRYAQRFWSLKYRGPADLSAAFVDTPDYGAFPAGPADDEKTYVRPA